MCTKSPEAKCSKNPSQYVKHTGHTQHTGRLGFWNWYMMGTATMTVAQLVWIFLSSFFTLYALLQLVLGGEVSGFRGCKKYGWMISLHPLQPEMDVFFKEVIRMASQHRCAWNWSGFFLAIFQYGINMHSHKIVVTARAIRGGKK